MKSKLKNAYSTCMECGGTKMKKGGKWIQKAIKKPGSFTAQAKREGMSVSGFKNKVLSNKENYSPTTVKRANLANTLSKMRKGQEGLEMPNKINLSSPRDVQWQTPKDNSPVRPDLVKKSDNWYTEEQWDNGMKNRPASFNNSPSKSSSNLVRGGTEKVAAYQQMLNKKLGLNLKVDGAWGPETQKAYERYKKMQSTSTPKSKTSSSKNWYTTEQWDKARGITNGRTADGLPAVNMPVSGGIKKRMQTGGSMTYETITSGPFKGRTFATTEIPQDQRMARLDELRIMAKEGKINRDQRQAMTDSITTYKQTKNPKISGGGAGPKYCPPGSVNVGNGNCKNKDEIHKKAASGYGNMRKGGLTNASMVSGSTKLPKKGQSFAKRKTTTPRFTLK